MRSPRVTPALRARIASWAQDRCCYCQTQERVSGVALTVEHIIPDSLGGTSDRSNLCLSCRSCNETKGIRVSTVDPETGEEVRLFHPRTDRWSEHFAWSDDGVHVVGRTAIGRATIEALRMNRPLAVQARRLWVQAGWHPPFDPA